ncbi:major facilitator superfamily domain-containing protein [Xylariaceae sp. FL1019]|nr:major facilitator superfamily domain-containing protein [Xylariaceae sp. FL1019]
MASDNDTTHQRYLVHSHAHEEDLPGTVNLRAADGDDTGYGQALFPVPAEDPNDPLQWSNLKKTMILIICSSYSFLANAALIGPVLQSPYLNIWAEEFGINTTKASELISYPNLAFGFGSLVFVPLYLKLGRRPVMLVSLITFCAGILGASRATTFQGLMGARVVHAFGSCVCEALPVQLVNDIFFLHERGERIGYYTVCLCLGTFASLPAGYILSGGYGWRLFFYVELAFGLALLVLAFLLVEETSYDRNAVTTMVSQTSTTPQTYDKGETEQIQTRWTTATIPSRRSFVSTLRPWGRLDPDVPVFTMMGRSFTYFLVPQTLWVIFSFGINIGLLALSYSYTFPILITAPPYNWTVVNSGLFALAALIGYSLAVPFASSSDRLASYLTLRNNGIREAEMRLGVMLPAMIIGPAGVILYGITAAMSLHWVLFFVGYWAAYFYFSFTLAYAVDSYHANTSEMLIAMNLGKQSISFGFGVKLLTWVMDSGYAVVVAGIFGGVLLANNLILLVFMIRGKNIRRFMSRTWLSRLHSSSIKEVVSP